MKKSEWIKCSERLPEVGVDVLCVTDDGYVSIMDLDENKRWWDAEGWWNFDYVTHWMPLPDVPEVEG